LASDQWLVVVTLIMGVVFVIGLAVTLLVPGLLRSPVAFTSRMTRPYARLYAFGYTLVGVGLLLLVLVIKLVDQTGHARRVMEVCRTSALHVTRGKEPRARERGRSARHVG
jgi:hypothetical protein